jgi:hypothetical protein
MSRGGARPGAGRKGLSPYEKLLIGAECQRRWDELAERLAIEQYEALPTTKQIRAEQARTHMIPVKLRSRPTAITKETLTDVRESIDDLVGHKGRRVTVGIKRPHGARPQLIRDVVAWVAEQHKRSVSESQVRESWKVFSAFLRSPEYRALNSPQTSG